MSNSTFPKARRASDEEKQEAANTFARAIRDSRQRAELARLRLEEVTPRLVEILQTDTGQAEQLRRIVWSCWNGVHQVGLCDVLCGLDFSLGDLAIAVIDGRLRLSGDADKQLRIILQESGEFDRAMAYPKKS